MTPLMLRQGTVFITPATHLQLHALVADAVRARSSIFALDKCYLDQYRIMMARGYRVVGERALGEQVPMAFTEPDYFAMIQVGIAATITAPARRYQWFDQLMRRIAHALGRDADKEWPTAADGG